MSKPILDGMFSLEGRRNRKSLLLYFLVYFVILTIVSAIATVMANIDPSLGIIVLLMWLPMPYSACVVLAQRCRDVGWTGWAVLIVLIPLIGMFFLISLFFIPGTDGPNRYGPDPTKPG